MNPIWDLAAGVGLDGGLVGYEPSVGQLGAATVLDSLELPPAGLEGLTEFDQAFLPVVTNDVWLSALDRAGSLGRHESDVDDYVSFLPLEPDQYGLVVPVDTSADGLNFFLPDGQWIQVPVDGGGLVQLALFEPKCRYASEGLEGCFPGSCRGRCVEETVTTDHGIPGLSCVCNE